MVDLQALLDRVKAATGPDRELDREICHSLGDMNAGTSGGEYASYTASIDAAVALVERRLLGAMWQVKKGIECQAVVWQLERDNDEGAPYGYHSEPALAVLVALLFALIAGGR